MITEQLRKRKYGLGKDCGLDDCCLDELLVQNDMCSCYLLWMCASRAPS